MVSSASQPRPISPEETVLITQRGFDRVVRQIVQDEMAGVPRLFLPGDGTVRASAAHRDRSIGML